MGEYYKDLYHFIEAASHLKNSKSGHCGVVDMVEIGDETAIEGVAVTNIGMAVLGLKYHLQVSAQSLRAWPLTHIFKNEPPSDIELVVHGVNQFIREEAVKQKRKA